MVSEMKGKTINIILIALDDADSKNKKEMVDLEL